MIKIISQNDYKKLVKASQQVEEQALNAKLKEAEEKYKNWKESYNYDKEQNDKQYELKIEKLEKELADLKADQKIILNRKEAEVDVRISTATKELTEKVQELTISNANYKREAEMLTTAFKNLGFDVKDMKEILNKLVDGVVSKNSVNIIRD